MTDSDDFKKCTTLGEFREATKDLPDDTPMGKWDADYSILYPWVDAGLTTVYKQDGDNRWSIYGGFDEDDPEPTRQQIVI